MRYKDAKKLSKGDQVAAKTTKEKIEVDYIISTDDIVYVVGIGEASGEGQWTYTQVKGDA